MNITPSASSATHRKAMAALNAYVAAGGNLLQGAAARPDDR